ncbi:MAG TPA: response regulator transcription factor [Thermoanaerobaculia bacterium]|jgi:DNA-binding NarL/FixJ family response regulator|nr:response regulator transcription factor [Thermoanaerobaculia bacterium]
MKPIAVMIVEDHPLVRVGIRAVLERQGGFAVAAEASDAELLLAGYEESGAEVVLIDLQPGRISGLEAIRALVSTHPDVRIVVLTHHCDGDHVSAAMSAGAQGYVLKSDDPAEMIAALRAVHAGRRYLSPAVSETLAGALAGSGLTLRERQVIGLMARGEKNRAIARALGVAEQTVKGHVKNILAKLGASTRTEAVSRAARRGWIRID